MLRGPEDVGCAHCTKLGADRACRICTRMVCPTCAEDWTTCDQPAGRVVRLGLGARVRAVDPSGTFALVLQWPRAPRVIDLRTFEVLPRALPRSMHTARLTRDERLLYFEEPLDPDLFRGIVERYLPTGQERTIFHPRERRPYKCVRVSATGDVYYFISESQEVMMIAADGSVDAIEPLPKKALQAVFLDAARGLVAAASWSEVALVRLGVGRLSHVRTTYEGDVAWLALGGGQLAVAVRRGSGAHIEIRVVDDQGIGRVTRELDVEAFHGAALSRDGRHLAIAADKVIVVDVDSGEQQTFDEHTDTISFVAFGADDHRLITADDDNRLIIRPRTADGYARPLVDGEARTRVVTARGDGPCTHCKTRGTTSLCLVCNRPVCDACHGEWRTCPEPAGIELRLGMSARVRAVDRAGTLASVSHWRKPLRTFDLRHLVFVSAPLVDTEARAEVSEEQKLHVAWPDGRTQILDPVPRQVILAHAIDPERRRIAAAAWGYVVVHDGTRELASYRVDGGVSWVALAADRVVALAGSRLHAWSGDEHIELSDVAGSLGAISRDGRYVALATGYQLDVFDLERGSRKRLPGHGDEINLVRFADDGMLITADTDNRLILRPRGPTGFTTAAPVLIE